MYWITFVAVEYLVFDKQHQWSHLVSNKKNWNSMTDIIHAKKRSYLAGWLSRLLLLLVYSLLAFQTTIRIYSDIRNRDSFIFDRLLISSSSDYQKRIENITQPKIKYTGSSSAWKRWDDKLPRSHKFWLGGTSTFSAK